MTDLEALAQFARTKAGDPHTPPLDRELWEQIADELDEWLHRDDPADVAGLFEATARDAEL